MYLFFFFIFVPTCSLSTHPSFRAFTSALSSPPPISFPHLSLSLSQTFPPSILTLIPTPTFPPQFCSTFPVFCSHTSYIPLHSPIYFSTCLYISFIPVTPTSSPFIHATCPKYLSCLLLLSYISCLICACMVCGAVCMHHFNRHSNQGRTAEEN